jgi:hypothetical protein
VSRGGTSLWPAEVIFEGERQMFLHNGWKHFICWHAIEAEHFVVFKYDNHSDFSEETMCRRHYHSNEDD